MSVFYHFVSSDEYDADRVIYGDYKWQHRYGLAEWSEVVNDSIEGIICPIHEGHQRAAMRTRELQVILPSPRLGDFVWTWYSECLITDRVLNLFKQAGFTGYEIRPVTIEKIKSVRKGTKVMIPTLWELVVVGKGGDAHHDSGIRLIYTCEACQMIRYSSYQNGIIVDEDQWDGTDFFTVNGYPKLCLVSERVKDLIITHNLTNCVLIPSHKMHWPDIVVRPEEVYPE